MPGTHQQKLMQAWAGCWGGLGALAVVFTAGASSGGPSLGVPVCGGVWGGGGVTLMPTHTRPLPRAPCATPLPRAPCP
jgi:hypothetical protein